MRVSLSLIDHRKKRRRGKREIARNVHGHVSTGKTRTELHMRSRIRQRYVVYRAVRFDTPRHL